VGMDKSAHRLYRSAAHTGTGGNYLLVRADLVDFWRLTATAGWPVQKQYLLYPNPWPKPDHLMRRWHGHPVFGSILATGGAIEVRSNWRVYVEEFAMAFALATGVQEKPEEFHPAEYLSPFERKYALSGQRLYRFVARQ
jgi:tRNA (guanine-N7-)-methyltransferase